MRQPPSKGDIDKVRRWLDGVAEGTHDTENFNLDALDHVQTLIAFIDYQEQVLQGFREDMRDAGRELREMESEINNLQRAAEYGGGW